VEYLEKYDPKKLVTETTLRETYLGISVTSFSGVHSDVISSEIEPICLSVMLNKYSKYAAISFEYGSDDIFIDALHGFQTNQLERKHTNPLISPARFDPILCAEKPRSRMAVRYVTGIWLDNDGGDLTHKEFADLFPHYRMAIYNSYSSKASLLKWRVFIPTSHLTSPDAYMAITKQIMAVLNDADYQNNAYFKKHPSSKLKKHGFDTSKLAPENLFYLPCQPADPTGYIWQDYNGGIRKPLDVMAAISNTILPGTPDLIYVPKPPKPVSNPNASDRVKRLQARLAQEYKANDTRLEKALSRWRLAGRGNGHNEFFVLASALHRIGLDEATIRTHLEFEATSAERRKEIPGLIRIRLKDRYLTNHGPQSPA
jgi:hypothetical protein